MFDGCEELNSRYVSTIKINEHIISKALNSLRKDFFPLLKPLVRMQFISLCFVLNRVLLAKDIYELIGF